MADDYGTCPNDLFEDERLSRAPLCTIMGAVLLMTMADDHGRLDGDAQVIARRVGCSTDEVDDILRQLEARHFIEQYEAAGRGGATKLVIQILDFHSYKGHPHRVAQPSKRGASSYPTKQGETVPSRRAREKRGTGVAEVWNDRGAHVAQAWHDRGTGVAEVAPDRGAPVASRDRARSAPCARDQHSTAQHSTESPPWRGGDNSVPDRRSASAPEQPALGGAGMGAAERQENNNGSNPSPRSPPGGWADELSCVHDRPEPDAPCRLCGGMKSRPPPEPPEPTPAQAACMAMRWNGQVGPEHSAALLAWARESGQAERKLRAWLEAREKPPPQLPPGTPTAERRAAELSRKFAPGQLPQGAHA